MRKGTKRRQYSLRVTDRELAAILAGLRLLTHRAIVIPAEGLPPEIWTIFTDAGRPLSVREIDALCERLNTT